MLSRAEGASSSVWRDIEQRLRERRRRRGHDRRQGEGRPQGRHRRRRVPAGLARRPPAGAQPRSLHRPARPLRDPQVQPLARQRRGLAPRRARARARRRSRKRRSRCSKRASSSRARSRTSPTTAPSSTSAASTACCTSPTCRGAASAHPSEVVNVGDQVKVVVLKYDPERERVSLGMKQIMPDPWTHGRASASRSACACTARS